MKLKDNGMVHNEPRLVEVATSLGVAVCFIAVIALFVTKLFRKLTSCCRRLLKTDKKKESKVNYEKDYVQLHLRSDPRRGRLQPSNRSYSVGNLYEFKDLPGGISRNISQPLGSISSSSGYNSSDSISSYPPSLDSISEEPICSNEFVQPRSSPRISRTSTEGFLPELYKRRRTQGRTSLGKIKLSLEYEDSKKHKLIMHLIELNNLIILSDAEPSSFYVTCVLLPEREYVLQSKKLRSGSNLEFNNKFTFFSRSEDCQFQSRTIKMTIMSVGESGKEAVYGELHIPLMSYEIFCQVPTELSMGIKAFSSQAVIGDAQIVLSYFSGQKKLNVLVKTLKFINPVLECMRGVQVKANIASLEGDRLSKKKGLSKSLSNIKSTNLVRFSEYMSFTVDTDNFMLCILKINIQARHKLIRKPTSIGKVRIGESIRDEAGKLHWKTVANSEETSWTLWHKIYAS